MTEYRLPGGYAQSEFTEKKSRFLSQIWPVRTEAEAREKIEAVKKQYHDARHNCWCFALRDGTLRYSDDGEPQGTSGLPTLSVFRAGEVQNVLCIVTRYFGGILLGTGGLVRAYSQTAKHALDAAGIAEVRLWERLLIACPYSLYERVRRELELCGAAEVQTDFAADVSLEALVEKGKGEILNARLRELSSGAVEALILGEEYKAVRLNESE